MGQILSGQLQNKSLVERVALVVVDGVSASVYARHGSACTNLPALFPAAVPIQFPGMGFKSKRTSYSCASIYLLPIGCDEYKPHGLPCLAQIRGNRHLDEQDAAYKKFKHLPV